MSGASIPVSVAATRAGYLLVLRVTTEGRVEVLYPTDPHSAGRVTRGVYRVRLVANEGRGTGLVVAALATKPIARSVVIPTTSGLGDIAQQLIGAGNIEMDQAIYSVRTSVPRQDIAAAATPAPVPNEPRALARTRESQQQSHQSTVVERTIVQPVVVVASVCDVGSGGCLPSGFRPPRRREPQPRTSGICQIGVDCPAGVGAPAKSVALRRR